MVINYTTCLRKVKKTFRLAAVAQRARQYLFINLQEFTLILRQAKLVDTTFQGLARRKS
jgi:hypothetical protein